MQSNEIRIPKPDFHIKTGPDPFSHNNSSSGGGGLHYFKSSFARSLFTHGSGSRSLDFITANGFGGEGVDAEPEPVVLDGRFPTSFAYADEESRDQILRGSQHEAEDHSVVDLSTESLVSSCASMATVKQVGAASRPHVGG